MAVLGTVKLHADERVLDAGCGSGRLTEELLGRIPAGQVVALDSSSQMLEQARQRLQRFGSRVEFVHASLQDFALARKVDGIFSNAVFHWVPDHAAMFRCLHRVLKPGGWLVAQFGGAGNLPHDLQGEFLREISRRTFEEEGAYVLDYVRLTVRAES